MGCLYAFSFFPLCVKRNHHTTCCFIGTAVRRVISVEPVLQADSSQKASSGLARVETAQASPSAETQALATLALHAANKSQDAEQQLSQIHADANVSNKVQDRMMSISLGNCGPCTDPCVASDACNRALPQQHESAESDQAACTTSADLDSHATPALQCPFGQALPPQSAAEANAESTPCMPSPKIASSASLSQPSQEAMVPEVLAQVWLLIMPYLCTLTQQQVYLQLCAGSVVQVSCILLCLNSRCVSYVKVKAGCLVCVVSATIQHAATRHLGCGFDLHHYYILLMLAQLAIIHSRHFVSRLV